MPFRIALSGLNSASADLRVIGNNVANASTTGYKKSRAEFADIFAASSLGTTSNAIGAGVRISSIAQQFTQGNIGFTDNNLDLAISGRGFFVMEDEGVRVYSRAGAFGVDRDGFVVNSQQQRLVAFEADNDGNITGASSALQLDTSNIDPSATANIDLGLNLNASADVPLAPVSSSTVTFAAPLSLDTDDTGYTTPVFTNPLIDNYGNAVANASIRWTHTGATTAVPQWQAELLVGGASTVPATTATVADITAGGTLSLSWDPDGGGAQSAVTLTADLTGFTHTDAGGGGTTAMTADVDGAVQGSFTIADTTSYNSSTSLTIYDSLGADHLATTYYRKTATPNTWEMYTFVDGVQISGPDVLGFSTTGDLLSITPTAPATQLNGRLLTTPTFTPTGSSGNVNPATMQLTFSLEDVSQYGSPFTVNALSQDGFATGRLSGVDIADSGVVTARFTNGQSRTLGQVALANFQNSQGLRQLGDTSWAETFESGAPLVGSPGSGSLGLIESGALEGSNVDLTEQLVGMITAQRNFQANAQVISTADTVTQTIINIR